ncbi:MFS transporter [Amycolatopsis sp. RTGN1]|uniref:MFS transporter n=1 Tax=Amycolatopsis ponsaeliensis TaxID=2992142 RepID=UPI00254F4E18|nr:MFS transporter [Amycolatopsis sp. RTGN1]
MGTLRARLFPMGAVLVTIGVLLHFPDYLDSRHHHFMMAGMPMSDTMWAGMGFIVIGLVLGGVAVVPPRGLRTRAPASAGAAFHAIDDAPLTGSHLWLIVLLTFGLVVDTMKPASLGFVVPGMAHEYGLTTSETSLLPFTAIVGTVIGSMVWGYAADLIGRRATLMFSGLIFVSTSICGFMPSFELNLVMCFLMGASAGGMLPTVYSLTSESIPAKRRGALVVLQSGIGAACGYLVASGSATLLIPSFSWRSLWLLGLPSGLLLLVMCRWIPESPRFLLAQGRVAEAHRVMAKYGIVAGSPPAAETRFAVAPKSLSLRTLLVAPYRRRTVAVAAYGLAWGIINWGFVTFLPTFLRSGELSENVSSTLFFASLFAIPSTLCAAYMYGRWSSRRSLAVVGFVATLALGAFALAVGKGAAAAVLFVLLAAIFASSAGMIAMLSPYSAEQYPTSLRARGTGLVAAMTKAGGMLGPLVVSGVPRLEIAAIATTLPVLVATVVLLVLGTETSQRRLVELEPVNS